MAFFKRRFASQAIVGDTVMDVAVQGPSIPPKFVRSAGEVHNDSSKGLDVVDDFDLSGVLSWVIGFGEAPSGVVFTVKFLHPTALEDASIVGVKDGWDAFIPDEVKVGVREFRLRLERIDSYILRCSPIEDVGTIVAIDATCNGCKD